MQFSSANEVMFAHSTLDLQLAPRLLGLEKAGDRYETQLKRPARNLLRQRHTDGEIDEWRAPEAVTYEDLARAAEPTRGGEAPSILKGIFHDVAGRDELLAAWLADDERDETITAKAGTGELAKLIRSRVGLAVDPTDPLAKMRRCGSPTRRSTRRSTSRAAVPSGASP